MRQIILQNPGQFELNNAHDPVALPGYALVKPIAIGICGTDWHAFAGRQPFFSYPRILGHELGVKVVSVPSGDHGIKPGDRCAVEPYLWCGNCPTCQAGRTNCCETLQVLGIHIDGGMQEIFAVPVEKLIPSKKLTFEQLALVETLSIGEHAVKRAGVQLFESVLVIGSGPIGLAVAQFAQIAGAKITIADINPNRRAFAEKFGFNAVTETDQLYDIVFDCTGSKASMERAPERAAFGGCVVFVGLVNDRVSFDDPLIHRRELTLLASRNSNGAFQPIIDLIEKGRIDTSPWVTHRIEFGKLITEFPVLAKEPSLIKAVVRLPE